jgi:hypothetical protein
MNRGAVLDALERALPWQQDYNVEINNSLVQVVDHRTGYFVTVMGGSLREIDWIIAQVRSWGKS